MLACVSDDSGFELIFQVTWQETLGCWKLAITSLRPGANTLYAVFLPCLILILSGHHETLTPSIMGGLMLWIHDSTKQSNLIATACNWRCPAKNAAWLNVALLNWPDLSQRWNLDRPFWEHFIALRIQVIEMLVHTGWEVTLVTLICLLWFQSASGSYL